MSKGEKAKITCPPEYGYGKKGTSGIPPNSTLIFEVELVDFKWNNIIIYIHFQTPSAYFAYKNQGWLRASLAVGLFFWFNNINIYLL